MDSHLGAGLAALLLLASPAAPAPAVAEDWPVWRGPGHDGSSSESSFVRGWLAGGLEECWRRPIGIGYAGLAVAGGVVHTMEAREDDEYVVALAAADGSERWRSRVGAADRSVYGGAGPRVTPTVAGELLYTVSSDDVLVALNSAGGRLVWRRDLAGELGARAPAEGYASSPLVDGDRLLVMLGGRGGKALAGFDRADGKLLWTSQDDNRASYSSPVPLTFAGVQQVLFLSASVLFSVDPANGRLWWRYPWPTYDDVNVATPLVLPPDRVFISSGYDQGAALLRVRRAGRGLAVEEVWRNRVMKNHFSSSVHHAGTIFGFDEAILTAVDAATGEERWRARGFGKGSLVLADGHLIVLGEEGDLVLAAAAPAEFVEKKRRRVLAGRSWTPPSPAGGRLYLRNRSEAVCLEPSAAPTGAGRP